GRIPQMSSPANAGDPVHRYGNDDGTAAAYWVPRFRGARQLVQSIVEQRLELRHMLGHQAGGGRSGSGAAGIARTAVRRMDLVQHPLQIRLDEMPGAHVARLFLAPDDL